MQRPLLAILVCLVMPGCVIVKVGVTNPVEGLSTVAIAPFFNLSQERAVDGRRFALAYYTELQKVPGFQVVPVGVTEQQIVDNGLEMDKPEDVVELARILNVDAVVVGAVTDYDPYYPPRIGLHVEWYSDDQWTFSPGIPTDPETRTRWRDALPHRWRIWNRHSHHGNWRGDEDDYPYQDAAEHASVRGQSPEPLRDLPPPRGDLPVRRWHSPAGPVKHADYHTPPAQTEQVQDVTGSSSLSTGRSLSTGQIGPNTSSPAVSSKLTCHKPLMSYTRMFDGTDSELVAALRDYVELSGDQRGGGWEAYLSRSEDFIRFTAHLMIVEMLILHGGDARRQIVFKSRKYK